MVQMHQKPKMQPHSDVVGKEDTAAEAQEI